MQAACFAKSHEAEESRKAEKHAVHIATANFRKQREELKLAHELAKILPDDFDRSSPDRAFSAAALHRNPTLRAA